MLSFCKKFPFFLSFSIFLIVVSFFLSLIYPPRLSNDAWHGVQVWDFFQRGGAFNHIEILDPKDISAPLSEFVTWWTPGQYFFSGLLESIGVPLGSALSLIVFLSLVGAVIGYYRLFIGLGFSRKVASISSFVFSISWFSLYSFRYFQGGEVFVTPFSSWALLYLLKNFPSSKKKEAKDVVVVFFLACFSVFLKASLALYLVACLVSIFILLWSEDKKLGSFYYLGSRLFFPVFLAFVVWRIFYFSGGNSPTDFECSRMGIVEAGYQAMLAQSGSIFAVRSLINNLPLKLSDWIWQVPLALLLPWILFCCVRNRCNSDYSKLILTFALFYFSIFLAFKYFGSCVSLEERHFRPFSILLIPGIVSYIKNNNKSISSVLFAILIFGSVLFAATSSAVWFMRLAHDALGARRISWTETPQSLITALKDFKRGVPVDGTTFLYLKSGNEPLLETPEYRSFQVKLGQPLKGRVNKIAIIFQTSLAKARALKEVEALLTDYGSTDWQVKKGKGWYIFSDIRTVHQDS